jgi:hypothetical protein
MATRRRHTPRSRTRAHLGILAAAVVLAALVGVTTRTVFTTSITVASSVIYDKQHTITAPMTELVPATCLPVLGVLNLYTNTTIIGNGTTNGNNPVLYLGNTGGGTSFKAGSGADCSAPGAVSGAGTYTWDGSGGGDRCYDGPSTGRYAYSNCVHLTYPYFTNTLTSPAFA